MPIPKGSKAPEIKDWTTRSFSEADFAEGMNIGVRLGEPSNGLTDIDLDVPEAVLAAPALLPKTERMHGRPGTGVSHYWYICPSARSFKWHDTDGKVLVEIRSTGGQTVLPPSIHPSGEVLFWQHDRLPAHRDYDVLMYQARSVATAALLARHWPTGSRHVAARDTAGFLAARDVDAREIEEIVRQAAIAASDNEVDDRVRVAQNTCRVFEAGGKTTGGPTLAASIGEDAVKRLLQWYGKGDSAFDAVVEELNKVHFFVRQGRSELVGRDDDADELIILQEPRQLYHRYKNKKVKVGKKATRKRDENDVVGLVVEDVEKTKFEIWFDSPKRREYRKVTFQPPPGKAHDDDYNLWRGFAVEPFPFEAPANPMSPAVVAAAKDQWLRTVVVPQCEHYLAMLHDVICGGEPERQEEYYAYLLDLLALTIQQPGVPSEVAIVLKGERGTGKGMFARNFGALFGHHFTQVSKPEQIVGRFNSTVSGKVVIFADEAFYAGDKRELSALKTLITEPTIRIEQKGVDPRQEPNFVHLIMASNEDWHTPAGFHERRFFALEVSGDKMQNTKYFGEVAEEMRSEQGKRALLTFLLHRQFDRQALRHAPRTGELQRQQEHTFTTEQRWWYGKLQRGCINDLLQWPLDVSPQEIHDDYIRFCDEMKINRRVTDNVLMRDMLGPALGEQRRVTRDGKRVWVRELLPLAECRQLFADKTGSTYHWPPIDDEPGNIPQDKVPF